MNKQKWIGTNLKSLMDLLASKNGATLRAALESSTASESTPFAHLTYFKYAPAARAGIFCPPISMVSIPWLNWR
jgi:hypothetical protein